MFGLGKPVKVEGPMNTIQWLGEEISDFLSSENRKQMLTGEQYYEVNNDIFQRKITRPTKKGGNEELKYKANNKLAHAFYKNLVDEKVNYLLGKDYTLKSDNEEYIKKLDWTLGDDFLDILNELGYEASNKGIGWLHIFINEDSKLDYMVIPSEQIIPIWRDRRHKTLDRLIRIYDLLVYEGLEKKTVTKIELWYKDRVEYYIKDGELILLDSEKYLNVEGNIGHYLKDGKYAVWGKIPFIAFKNNRIEKGDIKFIKSLIDNYDLSRSDVANFIEEVKNLIFVLKGYDGEDLGKFMDNLNYYRAIALDDDGEASTLNPTMDVEAIKIHYEQLKRDINECGQGVNKDLDKFGSAPSGIALKFLYSGIDLKCNSLEVLFKKAFKELLYFINIYLSESSQGSYKDVPVELIFNKNIKINETETITNCINSKGVISNKTIMANHPWVQDPVAEQEQLDKEKEEFGINFDNIPLPNKSIGENNEE
ncbi:phage portal protein [Clostridium perfringens]|uniref:Phage portal protein n=1 Tax=Clostridium perfringens TaxID=1502 RepID=A0AB37C7M6_CLOPF|nr:phage portal protein [Clostridium perfringens]PWW89686.1 phage portal protein [Clostridium perfringens]PWW90415.1 phage portal protein [Clostridium perfringens]PWX40012.1 phage portal protein [Clostridium perfringens]PWX71376.1 phage portal protein [Clostridium perfringens]